MPITPSAWKRSSPRAGWNVRLTERGCGRIQRRKCRSASRQPSGRKRERSKTRKKMDVARSPEPGITLAPFVRMKGFIDPFSEPQRQSGTTSHYLLGGWRDILDDIQKLHDAVDKLPEHCRCGIGEAHLGGRCACCLEGTAVRGCADCEALIGQIADRVEALRADDLRFSGVLRDFADRRPDHEEMREGLDDVNATRLAARADRGERASCRRRFPRGLSRRPTGPPQRARPRASR